MALLCGRRMFLLSHTQSPCKGHFLRWNVWDLSCLPSLKPCATHAPGHGLNRSQPQSARPLSVECTTSTSSSSSSPSSPSRFGDLSPLERLRARQLRDASKPSPGKSASSPGARRAPFKPSTPSLAESFNDLGLSGELMSAVQELKLTKPTEVQSLGIPAVLAGENVVMASHTGSGKTLAYMLPIVQALRRDEVDSGKATRARRPRCIVLCPTRELAEQVLYVAKSICHHARFRAAMIGGGSRMKQQEDTLNTAVDMIVATPGRLLMHIQEGHMAYGDIKYVALDEADTMFDKGFAPEVRKFLGPLRNRSRQAGDLGFQTVLVTATITKAVQKLLDEEFPGIRHIRTSTLHKKVASARHDFIKLSGAENKLEGLQQVLEPSLVKRNRIMVFCNTVNSCRAVDHYLSENGVKTLNYHGEVPADERVENLNLFREGGVGGAVPALICTDLAARGLDLVVDHVIMFDFPHNSIDYLHRTGRTARMGAKGRVTSLVTKRDKSLAAQIEDAMSKGESLEALTSSREMGVHKPQQPLQRRTQKSTRRDQKGNLKSPKFHSMGRPNLTLDKARSKSAPSVSRRSKGNLSKRTLEPSYR